MQPTICLFVMLVMAGLSLAQIPGGSTDANTNDAVIQRMARRAIVAGTMYHLDLDVNTRIGRRIVKYWSCEAKMLEVPWLNTLELVEFHCRKRS
ncbi:hypothetical protein MAR_011637 [Mya arenaria]|uniref:Uncharacterized protein n=1 Tax=Mya arenaria TaxID=6604 RepID=A0ABY7FUP7_MYAAR|nr:hypothetical protein MAR_011637 [Mya arenaria]